MFQTNKVCLQVTQYNTNGEIVYRSGNTEQYEQAYIYKSLIWPNNQTAEQLKRIGDNYYYMYDSISYEEALEKMKNHKNSENGWIQYV